MSLSNTHQSYGSLSKAFHWATVLLIFTVIPLGIIANGLAHEVRAPGFSGDQAVVARTVLLFSLHKTIGVTIFFLALARIVWALRQPKPELLNGDKPLEATLAEMVHWLLYGSLILVPLTGWIHHAATSGFAPIRWPFGQNLPFVPKDETLAHLSGGLHVIFERVLVLAIFLHVAGALKHHVIDRDATLRRMLPGQITPPATPVQNHSGLLALLGALAIWGAALGVGSALGVIGGHGDAKAAPELAPELAEVQSDWQVQDGTLGLSVQQMGSAVEGSFADWTAAIRFAEPDAPGPAGSVEVTIAIASLTLGSVTDQAMGADFFDAGAFPTATFNAEIVKTDTGYVARGPLTIKDRSVPIELPFELTLEGNRARMQGSVTLRRLDFGIGAAMPDDSSLGFDVVVSVSLSAAQTE